MIISTRVITMIDTVIKTNSLEDSEKESFYILKIQTEAIMAIHDYLYSQGLIQMMPVILSPITDPLNHSVYDASIQYMGQNLQLTKSMILHKQVAIATKIDSSCKGIYIMSPNVRLEKEETDRHLLEFSQVDIELREADSQDFRILLEGMIVAIFERIRRECKEELLCFGRDLNIPSRPFKIFSSEELKEKFGPFFEEKTSCFAKNPFWITDFKREFYDKEDPENKGHYINYDLIYPDGFGEALSGGERDYEYDILVRKMKERNQDPDDFDYYLKHAKAGNLIPSAGGGLGIERLIRFITKKPKISDVTMFAKIPGRKVNI